MVNLLVVRVPRIDVHQVDNRATRRVGTSCQPMSAVQIAGLLAERRGDDWSAEETERPLTDVSAAALEQARGLCAPRQTRSAVPTPRREPKTFSGFSASPRTAERSFAPASPFCEPTSQLPPLVYQYRRTPAGEPVTTRPSGPVLSTLMRALELVSARLDTTPVNLPGGQQIQLADLPEAAIREAIANAVIHRDYRLTGAVRVEHAPTRLTITSLGPFVQGVTVANILTTSSRPRKPASPPPCECWSCRRSRCRRGPHVSRDGPCRT